MGKGRESKPANMLDTDLKHNTIYHNFDSEKGKYLGLNLRVCAEHTCQKLQNVDEKNVNLKKQRWECPCLRRQHHKDVILKLISRFNAVPTQTSLRFFCGYK